MRPEMLNELWLSMRNACKFSEINLAIFISQNQETAESKI